MDLGDLKENRGEKDYSIEYYCDYCGHTWGIYNYDGPVIHHFKLGDHPIYRYSVYLCKKRNLNSN